INSVAFTPDGKHWLTAYDDGIVKLWNAATARMIRTFRGHRGKVMHVVAARPHHAISAAEYDRTTRVWDLATGTCVRTFENSDLTYEPAASELDPEVVGLPALGCHECVERSSSRG